MTSLMAVVRVTRRYAGLLSVLALFGLILLVGPPETPATTSGAHAYADIDFSPVLQTDRLEPDATLPAAARLRRIGVGVWSSGATTRDLPVLEIHGQTASPKVRDNDILEAAVDIRSTALRTAGATISTSSQVVFGDQPGVVLRSSRGNVEQTTWLGVRDHTLYTATVLHAPDQMRAATALLETVHMRG
ncbi:MAG: hypothetical protein H7287_04185 [Thermoleophilia bacterium]|nr:hypothetical protein [Thermoleophilia bacterium]